MLEPHCPKCNYQYTYMSGQLWVCPDCAHEWNAIVADSPIKEETNNKIIKDAVGNILADGDSISVIKDLKIKGSSTVVKVGSKAKNIKLLLDSNDGHDIACKIEGYGSINLKSEFVKKL